MNNLGIILLVGLSTIGIVLLIISTILIGILYIKYNNKKIKGLKFIVGILILSDVITFLYYCRMVICVLGG